MLRIFHTPYLISKQELRAIYTLRLSSSGVVGRRLRFMNLFVHSAAHLCARLARSWKCCEYIIANIPPE